MKKLQQFLFVILLLVPGASLAQETPASLQAPHIIITEIMHNPNVLSEDVLRDTEGEWFELYNASEVAIDLSGWTIKDAGVDSIMISPDSSFFIPSHQAVVLCQNSDQSKNGDFPCDYVYLKMLLDNNGDEIILFDAAGSEIDRVEYDGGSEFPSQVGASIYFTGMWRDDNNDGSLWAISTERAPNFQNDDCMMCVDFGSPGMVSGTFLPVELASFSATGDGADVSLNWETASELNNAGFEVEQLVDGHFATIGWVAGAGTTDASQRYHFEVQNTQPGLNIFRLKQVDFDGTLSYSERVHVMVAIEQNFVDAPYPNPFNPETTISFGIARAQQVRVEVVDMLGRRVATAFDGPAQANTRYDVRISGAHLPSGRYLVHVIGESFSKAHSIYLVK